MFGRKREYGIYYHSLYEEGEGKFVIAVRGYWKAWGTVNTFNSATLSYGWYYLKRIR
jgi:hypothetical protein